MNPILAALLPLCEAYTPGADDMWELLALAAKEPQALSLETLVTHPLLGGFTEASLLQRVLMRAADGHDPRQWLTPEEALEHFNLAPESVWPFSPTNPPKDIVPEAGVRCGKSLIAALAMVLGILRADFAGAHVRPGEYVRAVVVTPSLETSKGTFAHIAGTLPHSPVLRRLLVKEPGAESLRVRRPDGRECDVLLLAAKAKGLSLRSGWLVGLVLDEAEFHLGEDAKINLTDSLDASAPRMLGHTTRWMPSSPWADTGPYHDLFTSGFGEPGKGDAKPEELLAFRSSSRALNPNLNREEEERAYRKNPDKAAREYGGIPLSSLSTQFFTPLELSMSISREPWDGRFLEPIPAVGHAAGGDAGFRKNSSALAIARENPVTKKVELAYHSEHRPQNGKPLVPKEVVAGSWVPACLRYGVERVHGDLHYSESVREHLATPQPEIGYEGDVTYGEFQPTAEVMVELAQRVKGLMAEGRCWIPNDPVLARQFKDVQSKPIGGRTHIIMPRDGQRHGDVLFAGIIALAKAQEATARAAGAGRGYYRNRSSGAYSDALAGRTRDTRSRW